MVEKHEYLWLAYREEDNNFQLRSNLWTSFETIGKGGVSKELSAAHALWELSCSTMDQTYKCLCVKGREDLAKQLDEALEVKMSESHLLPGRQHIPETFCLLPAVQYSDHPFVRLGTSTL